MLPLITDSQFNSLMLVVIALITTGPAIYAAYNSREAKKNSKEAADQVRTNGGMSDPDPNVNDHIKYQTKMMEELLLRQDNTEKLLGDHLTHSQVMDQALAEVYLAYKSGGLLIRRTDEND